jgi:hypothetical protein
MSEENKDGKAAEPNDWAKHWKPKDFVSPSPFTRTAADGSEVTREQITRVESVLPIGEQLDAAIDRALESPEVDAALANVAAEAAEDAEKDAQFDAALAAALELPEIKEALDNVAAESNEWQPGIGLTRLDVIELRLGGLETALKFYKERIKSLESRVAAAMKHAGFKF